MSSAQRCSPNPQPTVLPLRGESTLPHDLYPRQVQPEYWAPGSIQGDLGPSEHYVRHAGTGELDPGLSQVPDPVSCGTEQSPLLKRWYASQKMRLLPQKSSSPAVKSTN